MIFLFLGNNPPAKTKEINDIKAKYLSAKDAAHFDFELLYADKLEADELKKALLALPAVSKKRVVVVKAIEKLKEPHQKIIAGFLAEKDAPVVLILDSDQTQIKGAFINDVRRIAKTTVYQDEARQNVFDMTRAMERRQPVEALKILSDILDEGDQPVQIMGALVWFWGRKRSDVPLKRFQRGLECLQEADLNIKRSRLRPQFALEKLVVSLAGLLA